MAQTLTGGRTSMTRFYVEGKYTDFRFVCQGFTFEVHKLVLSSASDYLETICNGRFKEASEGVVNFKDDNVRVLARVIQAIYTGDYPDDDDELILPKSLAAGFLLDAVRTVSIGGEPTTLFVTRSEYATHAQVYAFAERYNIAWLKEIASSKFGVALVASEAQLHTDDLIEAIDIVYSTIPSSDAGLRKWIVYTAQSYQAELKLEAAFKNLMEKNVDFAWDFATKYGNGGGLWCCACNDWSRAPSSCDCGFYGLCGSRVCTGMDWDALRCVKCKKRGQMLRERPRKEDDVSPVGACNGKKKINDGQEKTRSPKKARVE